MKILMTRTLHIFALLSLAALICGQLGRLCWFAELFSHFLPYYAAVFLLAACLPRGKYWCGFWTVATLASILWLLHPLSLANAPPTGERLIWYNVHLNNPDAAGESAALLAEKPTSSPWRKSIWITPAGNACARTIRTAANIRKPARSPLPCGAPSRLPAATSPIATIFPTSAPRLPTASPSTRCIRRRPSAAPSPQPASPICTTPPCASPSNRAPWQLATSTAAPIPHITVISCTQAAPRRAPVISPQPGARSFSTWIMPL